jgi:pyruvate/2-oxoglutarate dehydrogenase complex dihydrolipoamide dehydrogenase (E3) component
LESVDYLTNETILDLKTLPKHLIVLGGGHIGLEFGQMFVRFGSQVTVIEGAGQIVPREDPEVAAELQRALEAEKMKFLLSAQTTRVERKDGSIVLTAEGARGASTAAGSHLLVAIGAPSQHGRPMP